MRQVLSGETTLGVPRDYNGTLRLILDAHLDLAWNALSFDRDQLQPIDELRRREKHLSGKSRGNCTVSLPEMRRAGVAACLGTVLCRATPSAIYEGEAAGPSSWPHSRGDEILRDDLDYVNQTVASAMGVGQLEYYRLLEQQGHIKMIRTRSELGRLWGAWREGDEVPIGCILSMEGADPIVSVNQAEVWFERGLRTACVAHYGPSAYAMGTGGDGPLSKTGKELVKEFDRLGIILDLVHTADTAFGQALDLYSRPVFCSHGNCRALVPGDRQLTDDQIKQIVARGGVIGAVFDAWMIVPGYRGGDESNSTATLEQLADHVDHVCQLAGSVRHSGIGSDLDGGFGNEQTPKEIKTIADLHSFAETLAKRGYSDGDLDAIFHGNWLRFFGETLPE